MSWLVLRPRLLVSSSWQCSVAGGPLRPGSFSTFPQGGGAAMQRFDAVHGSASTGASVDPDGGGGTTADSAACAVSSPSRGKPLCAAPRVLCCRCCRAAAAGAAVSPPAPPIQRARAATTTATTTTTPTITPAQTPAPVARSGVALRTSEKVLCGQARRPRVPPLPS